LPRVQDVLQGLSAQRFKLSSYDVAHLDLVLREGLQLAILDADLRSAMEQVGGALV
jgi:hypothetical protein